MMRGCIMTEWIRLAIDDYPFATRVAWIPYGLPADVLLELQTIKQHEHIPLMIPNPNEPQTPGCWSFISNPEMPEAVYLSICKWKDIIEDKPHIIGPDYMGMVMDDLDHDGFEGYKEELHNNLPDWRKDIQREEPANGAVVLNIFIGKFLD